MNVLKKALTRQPHLPRFLCHLYQRLHQRKLNLVTGAGISSDAGVPGWHGLLERLAESERQGLASDLKLHRSSGLNPEYLGQIIYHRFKTSFRTRRSRRLREAMVEYGWGKAIREAIYENVTGDIAEIVNNHPYLAQLRDLARKVPLVINFNFDDILADSIGDQIKSGRPGNSLTVTWRPPLTDRPNLTTMYHVNGVLPRVSLRKRSPQIIFTEDSFADAMARSPGASAEYLFFRFVQNTMLLIGSSLADSSLKNYLRRNRDRNPANHHYMIYWLRDETQLSKRRRKDIFDANLELYNLITIFLTSVEIHCFLDILNRGAREFRDIIDSINNDGISRFHYYIVGPVAAGKSTLLEHLRCFETYEEWTRPPPPEMYLASDKINDEQKDVIDKFIYSELKEKNKRMHDAGVGFHFMDRGPLDLYAFTKTPEENKRKSRELHERVTRDMALQKGAIIFTEALPDTLVVRNMNRGRSPDEAGTGKYFAKQIEKLKEIYRPIFIVSTERRGTEEAARDVARHALLGDYKVSDLDSIIRRYDD